MDDAGGEGVIGGGGGVGINGVSRRGRGEWRKQEV